MPTNTMTNSHAESFDYIVVGAGTAGCLMANRLSADPQNRVLLIEAGGRDNYHWIHIPVGYLYCINNPRTDWLFRTEPDKGLNGRSLIYPRGKTLGGCSSINGMIYMRGQARDYNHWAEVTGSDEWRWENCLPDFIKHENHYRLDKGSDGDETHRAFHGHGGTLTPDDGVDCPHTILQVSPTVATTDANSNQNCRCRVSSLLLLRLAVFHSGAGIVDVHDGGAKGGASSGTAFLLCGRKHFAIAAQHRRHVQGRGEHGCLPPQKVVSEAQVGPATGHHQRHRLANR